MQRPLIDLKRSAEAARYALLRRLVPAIRHDMAGSFQPVTMLAMIVEKRLLAATPDLSTLVKNCNELRTLALAATHTNLDLIGWMAVDTEARVALGQGIADAVHLVAAELSFRGLRFLNQTEGEATEVRQDHLRGVFMAALLALADGLASPANVLLTATRDGQDMLITITSTDMEASLGAITPHKEFQIGLSAYRKIDWHDVQAIADIDGLSVIQEAESVLLRLPISSI
jgi:hypothetical protein